jgi:beta-lactamase class C
MLGLIAAKSMHGDFSSLMQTTVFSPLGLRHTYLDVPAAQANNYAQGYTSEGIPIRMTPGVLGTEAYGVRTTAGDLLRFLEANLQMLDVNPKLQHAITNTHTAYYLIGPMIQDLIWEQYPYPVTLKQLLGGNSDKIISEPNPALALEPPVQPQDDVFINKTGSTNGFATYVAFVPREKIGIVLLANRSYPIPARVTAGYNILSHLRDSGISRHAAP